MALINVAAREIHCKSVDAPEPLEPNQTAVRWAHIAEVFERAPFTSPVHVQQHDLLNNEMGDSQSRIQQMF